MHSELLLVIVVVTALAFDFTNGFHDTANVVASVISTRALQPRSAVLLASILNFVGALLSVKVAATIATGIVQDGKVTETIMFAGLVGAITWNLLTWRLAMPSSSSHALIGGVVGAMLAAVGVDGVNWHGLLTKALAPAVVAPLCAFVFASLVIAVIYQAVRKRRPGSVNRTFRAGQVISSSLLSLAHGTNDAQKTMGVIALALLANGDLDATHFNVPTWVILAAASAMALGTYAGGWPIVRTVGTRVIKMDTAQGFTAQGVGAAVILVSTHYGYPLSSTQVIAGGIAGAGAAKRLSAVRWGVAGNIVFAWLATFPLAACFGALAYWCARAFGTGALGPTLIVIVAAALISRWLHSRRVSARAATVVTPSTRPLS